MYFNEKENTSIDEELKKSKRPGIKLLSRKAKILIGVIVTLIIIALIILAIYFFVPRYYLILNGSTDMTIYQGTTYNEPGYEAHDSKKNNLYSEVTVRSDLDSKTIGTYTITYVLRNKVKTRTVKVIAAPDNITSIHLYGEKITYLKVGDTYNEPGYLVIDAVDGDITDKVTVTNKVDTSKKGTYRVVYSVINSSGVTTSETRTIIVQ